MIELIIVSIWGLLCYLIGLFVGQYFHKEGGKKMTTEEKATELGIKYQTPCHGIGDCEFEARQAAIEMAEWKEQQMIEKACERLEDNLASFWQCKLYDDIAFIDDFKQAMEK